MPQIKRLTPKTSGPKPMPRPREVEPFVDATGQWKRAVKAAALELGIDWQRLYDEFLARAACRYYCGADVRDAEFLAWGDIQDRIEQARAA